MRLVSAISFTFSPSRHSRVKKNPSSYFLCRLIRPQRRELTELGRRGAGERGKATEELSRRKAVLNELRQLRTTIRFNFFIIKIQLRPM